MAEIQSLPEFRALLVSSSPKRAVNQTGLAGLSAADIVEDTGAKPPSNGINIVIAEFTAGEEPPFARVRAIVDEEVPPPVLVCGPPADGWRRAALEAGAFACMSSQTDLDDKLSLIAAALRYRDALEEIEHLREEANRICTNLLQSFGEASETLANVRVEAKRIREDLDNVRERILRAFV